MTISNNGAKKQPSFIWRELIGGASKEKNARENGYLLAFYAISRPTYIARYKTNRMVLALFTILS